MEVGYSLKTTAPGYMDLYIEKIDIDKICVAHYYTRQGDLMSDPEVVFRIVGDDWVPIRFTQHPNIHQYDESGLSIQQFLDTWERNIRLQGYLEHASNTLNHPG